MKLLKHKQTGFYRIVGNYGSSGGFPTKQEALADYKRVKRNALKREKIKSWRNCAELRQGPPVLIWG